jgi:hypothetical protein
MVIRESVTPQPLPLVRLSEGFCPICSERLTDDRWCWGCVVGWRFRHLPHGWGHEPEIPPQSLAMYRVPDVEHSSELEERWVEVGWMHQHPDDAESALRREHSMLSPA